MNKIVFMCVLASVISAAFAETCLKPEITSTSYVTEDATVLTSIAFTMQFMVSCQNGVKGISLYADVEGKTFPAVKLSSDNSYQISWTEDIKKARSGDYYIKLYDEEKYAAVRKAIRNGEDPESVKSLATITLTNPGIYLGPWVNSEFLAAFLATLVSYTAFSAKYKLLA